MKKLFAIALLMLVTACNTVSGVGKDISGVADWTHDKITGGSVDLKQEPRK